MNRYLTLAALFLVFFGLFVNAELRARRIAEFARQPILVDVPQELLPDNPEATRVPYILRHDTTSRADAYFIETILINQQRYPCYSVEIQDASGALVWKASCAIPDKDDRFRLILWRSFLQSGEDYALVIHGLEGDTSKQLGWYPVRVPSE